MASALVLSAASPFWASLLNKQGENDVLLPDEKTATVRTYLEAIFACNTLYQNARIRKYFNVSRKGKLSELRSFVYPQVSVEILDSEKKLQRYVVISLLVLAEEAAALRHVVREQAGGDDARGGHVVEQLLRSLSLLELHAPV